MLVKREKNALEIPLPDLQVKSITERGLWKYEALQEVVWLPETFSFSLLVSILPDKIDISWETCGNYYREIGLNGLNNHDLKDFNGTMLRVSIMVNHSA